MRLMEGLRLRVKDVDFDSKVIIVRDGKGDKDRVVMLPQSLVAALKDQFAQSHALSMSKTYEKCWACDAKRDVAALAACARKPLRVANLFSS